MMLVSGYSLNGKELQSFKRFDPHNAYGLGLNTPGGKAEGGMFPTRSHLPLILCALLLIPHGHTKAGLNPQPGP